MSINVLQIISKNDKYGAQRIFLDQVSILHRMGNHVVVVAHGTEGYVTDSVLNMGIPYYGISMKSIKDIFFLRHLVKKHCIDVIHTSLDRADYFGLLLSRLTRRPVVSTMYVPRYHTGYRFVDKVIIISNKQKKLLKMKGINSKKICLIRPGIDTERFTSTDVKKRDAWKQKIGIDQYSIIFCHISSLIPRKAHTVSLELIANCKKMGELPLLVIVGDPRHGGYYESLLRKITDLGLMENVLFTGWTSEIPEILSLSHFTILPSENEALGVVLMEGMAAGTPIIAREGEGGAELVGEFEAGFLYKMNESIKALAEKVIAVHRNTFQYQSLSSRCKKIATEEFTLSLFGDRLMELYLSTDT